MARTVMRRTRIARVGGFIFGGGGGFRGGVAGVRRLWLWCAAV